MVHYADAKQALQRLHPELMHINPSAARSLEEGMEETLTVHKLHTPNQIRTARPLCAGRTGRARPRRADTSTTFDLCQGSNLCSETGVQRPGKAGCGVGKSGGIYVAFALPKTGTG